MTEDPLAELRRHVEDLSREVFGDWRKRDHPGLRQRVKELEETLSAVERQHEELQKEMQEEERKREIEAARREGAVVLVSRGKEIITFITGGGVLLILGWLWRQLGGGG